MLKKLFASVIATSCLVAASAQHHINVPSSGDIGKAVAEAVALPGRDTVFIHVASGTYFLGGPITFTASLAHPLVIEGDAGDVPVISGGYPVGGWEVTPEGWWRTHVPEVVKYGRVFQQLYVNGERAVLARTPDKGLFDVIGQVD